MNTSLFKISKHNILVLENAVLLFFSSGLNFLLPFLVSGYLVHLLGIERFGFYSYILALVGYLQCIIIYGFNLTGTNAMTKSKENPIEISKIFSNIFYAKCLLFIISIIIFFFVFFLNKEFKGNAKLVFSTAVILFAYPFSTEWFFQGMQDLRKITLITSLLKTVSIIGIFTCIKSPEYGYVAALFLSVGVLSSSLISFFVAIKKYEIKLHGIKFINILYQLKEGRFAFFSYVGVILYSSINFIILKHYFGNKEMGYYTAADRIIQIFVGVYAIISLAIFPHLATLKKNNPNSSIIYLGKICKIFLVLSVFTIISLLILGPTLIKYFSGQQIPESIRILNILAFSLIPNMLIILFTYFIIIFEKSKDLLRAILLTVLCNILLSFPLIKNFKGIGLAILININFSILAILYTLIVIRIIRKNKVVGDIES